MGTVDPWNIDVENVIIDIFDVIGSFDHILNETTLKLIRQALQE